MRSRVAGALLFCLTFPAALSAANRVGDADLDGNVLMADASLVQDRLYGAVAASSISPLALADGDGELDIADLMLVAQAANGVAVIAGPGSLLALTPPSPVSAAHGDPDIPLGWSVASSYPALASLVNGMEAALDKVPPTVESLLAPASLSVTGGAASGLLTPINNSGALQVFDAHLTFAFEDSSGVGLTDQASDVSITLTPSPCNNGLLDGGEACDDGLGGVCLDDCSAFVVEGRDYQVDTTVSTITNQPLFNCLLKQVFSIFPRWVLTFAQTGPGQIGVTSTVYGDSTVVENWGNAAYTPPATFSIADPTGFNVNVSGLPLSFRNIAITGDIQADGRMIENLTVDYELNLAPISLIFGIDLCDLITCLPDGYAPIQTTGGRAWFVPANCPDGVVDADEDCDDGFADPNDGCNPFCRFEVCGDRVVQTALGETCDDGNPDDTDLCPSTCVRAYCGDGFVYAGSEECDMGPLNGMGLGCEAGCLLTPVGAPAPIPGTQMLFSFDSLGSGAGFYNFPYPNDLRLGPGGFLDLSGFPNPLGATFLTTNLPIMESRTKGFGTSSGIYLAFDGPLDGSLLPDPDNSRLPGSPVFLMDVDPGSPQQGNRWPLVLSFNTATTTYLPANVLVAIPYPGIPMRPDTQYALVLTNGVLDLGSQPLGASADFQQMKDPTPSGDSEIDAGKSLYTPVFDYLDATHGIVRSQVRAMTVFTTGNPVEGMMAIHAAVNALPVPGPNSLSYVTTDNPGGPNGFRRYQGSYNTPIYQDGTAPYLYAGGEIVFDGSGVPIQQGTENLNFILCVPLGKMPTDGWPVAVYAHGTGGSRFSPLGPSDECAQMARNRIAVLSINQPLHGDRVPPGSPDPDILAFNFLNILSGRDNWRQSSADSLQAFRFIRSLILPPGITGPGGGEQKFDPDKVYFVGHSQGAITGPIAMAVEPDFKGGVFSGAGGGLALSVLTKTQPVAIAPIAAALVCMDTNLETIDLYHPLLQLVQTFIEVSDPVNYGRLLIDEPVGAAGKSLFYTSGLFDAHATPETLNAAVTAIGMNQIDPVDNIITGLSLKGFGTEPVTARLNRLDGFGGSVTAGVIQYYGDHFVIYNDTAAQYTYGHFLGTFQQRGAAAICYSPNTDVNCSVCGDGLLGTGEVCDQGQNNGNGPTWCKTDCSGIQ